MSQYTISELWIYPVKSLAGISVREAIPYPKGFLLDRRWMLIDENNQFISQRTRAELTQFRVTMTDDKEGFQVHAKDSVLKVRLYDEMVKEPIQATIWNDTVTVFETNPRHSDWFTAKLGFPCRLVHFPEENPRGVDPAYNINNNQVSLADAYPYLVIGQSSLDHLNAKLDRPLPMNRFRPNIVFTGGTPHEEDDWRNFSIGDAVFAGVKPCSRCNLTTIDQTTGQSGVEPLKTLASYRKTDNKILFGQNALALVTAKIFVGDTLEVLRRKDEIKTSEKIDS
jgi:uncharacterized protein YcbX